MISASTKPVNQSISVEQLIEQAKLFSEKYNIYHTLFYAYDELKTPPAPSFEEFMKTGKSPKPKKNTKQQNEKIAEALKFVLQARQEVVDHPFRQLLHKQLSYKQAFSCFKKKIFNFYEKSTDIGVNDQFRFDESIATALSSYQYISAKKEQVLFWKKSRIEKIKKLAKTLQAELSVNYLFDNEEKQQRISMALDPLIELKNPPRIIPMRRHTKIARELMIKNLAFNFYGIHYDRMAHYRTVRPYRQDEEEYKENKKLTLNASFIDAIAHLVAIVDPSISERRVASVVSKIKPQIQIKHPLLFKFA